MRKITVQSTADKPPITQLTQNVNIANLLMRKPDLTHLRKHSYP